MATGTVVVRSARVEEYPEVRRLLESAYGAYVAAVSERVFKEYLAELLDLDSGGRPTTLVAFSGDQLVGTARLYLPSDIDMIDLPDDWAWVRAVAVRPDQQRNGIARTLMDVCVKRAAAAGAVALSLHTAEFMASAVKLYEALGYTRAPEWDLNVGAHYGITGDQSLLALAHRLDLKG